MTTTVALMADQIWAVLLCQTSPAPTRHKAYTNRDLRGKDWCVSGVRLDMFDTVHVMCQSRARCVILIHHDTVGQNILGLKSSIYLILQQFEGIMACVVYNCYLWPGSGPVVL